MTDPYRSVPTASDLRHEAETKFISAKASMLAEMARGLAIANNLARAGHESSQSYERRVKVLKELHQEILRSG